MPCPCAKAQIATESPAATVQCAGADFCKFHGGHAKRGAEHGRYKHGRHANRDHLPKFISASALTQTNRPATWLTCGSK